MRRPSTLLLNEWKKKIVRRQQTSTRLLSNEFLVGWRRRQLRIISRTRLDKSR